MECTCTVEVQIYIWTTSCDYRHPLQDELQFQSVIRDCFAKCPTSLGSTRVQQVQQDQILVDSLPSSILLIPFPSVPKPDGRMPIRNNIPSPTQGLNIPRPHLFTQSPARGFQAQAPKPQPAAGRRLQGNAAQGSLVTGRFHAAIACRAQPECSKNSHESPRWLSSALNVISSDESLEGFRGIHIS